MLGLYWRGFITHMLLGVHLAHFVTDDVVDVGDVLTLPWWCLLLMDGVRYVEIGW